MCSQTASITEQYNSGIDYQITSKYDLKYNYDRCIQFESQKQSRAGTANIVNNHIELDLETQALQALLPKIYYETSNTESKKNILKSKLDDLWKPLDNK